MNELQVQKLATALLKEMDFTRDQTLELVNDTDALISRLCYLQDDLEDALLTFFNECNGNIEEFAKDRVGKKELDAWKDGKPLAVDAGLPITARTFEEVQL